MSTKIPSLAAGLAALGLSLSTTHAVADEPTPPAPAPASTPTDAPASPRAATTRVLLLTDGKVLQGVIEQDDAGYVVHHKLGDFRKKRREVEKAFATLQDAYQYQLARTPRRDPDERMKLARWCLDNKLNAEARAELEGIVELDPDNRQAKAMLYNLAAAAERATSRDALVARTAAEPMLVVTGEEPAALDLAGVRNRREGASASGPPVILDLPPPLAVRRYQEFLRNVHPVLQNRCVKCHNEQVRNGDFQLIQVRSRRDASNDLLLRTNLDAVMALVDPNKLGESRLLALAFRPHGPSRLPLFTGPNDPSFRVLSTWVNSLVDPSSPRVAATPPPGPFAPVPTGNAPAFAAGRAAPPTASAPAPKPIARPGVVPPRGPGVPDLTDYPTQPIVDADFNTTSPLLVPGPNAARVGAARTPAPAGGQPAPPAVEYLKDAQGNPVLDPSGQPIPVEPKNAKPAGRAPKNFNLDGSNLQQMLNRPR